MTFPKWVFALTTLILVGATLFYRPGWGLMDDSQNLKRTAEIQDISSFGRILSGIVFEFQGGFVRPVYQIFVSVFYPLFREVPTLFYILILLINMAALVLWGHVFARMFGVRKNTDWAVYLFPLTFFLFTPFWNIFMYLSLQEKFLFWISPLVFLSFQKHYETGRIRYGAAVVLLILTALMSKPTGVFLAAVLPVVALYHLFSLKDRRAVSLFYLVSCAVIFAVYAWFSFTYQMNVQYTGGYKENFGFEGLITAVTSAPLVVQALFGLGGITLAGMFLIRIFRREKTAYPLLIPLSLVAYLTILSFYEFRTYLFSGFAPFVPGCFFSLFMGVAGWKYVGKPLVGLTTLLLLGAVVYGLVLPRISSMGDIAGVTEFMKSNRVERSPVYFLPPPHTEPEYALGYLTGRDVDFVEKGRVTAKHLEGSPENYLLIYDQARTASFLGVRAGEEVFRNTTWRVYRLHSDPNVVEETPFGVGFEDNPVQRLKNWIKSL